LWRNILDLDEKVKEKYNNILKKEIIPILERMSKRINLWDRKWEDSFETGMTLG